MTTLHEIVHQHAWESVEAFFAKAYPEADVDDHSQAYERLRFMQPKPTDFTIVLTTITPEPPEQLEDAYVDVSGRKKVTSEGEPESWAIEYTPWAEWLGADISEESLAEFGFVGAITHCLWEMTFCGYDEDEIQGKIADVRKQVDEFKDAAARGDLSGYKTLDQLRRDALDTGPAPE